MTSELRHEIRFHPSRRHKASPAELSTAADMLQAVSRARMLSLPQRRRRLGAGSVLLATLAAFVLLATASSRASAQAPPQCWVGWRPSSGSITYGTEGRMQTTMTVKLRWRGEDLTFRSCRQRTAFELETYWGTSNNRHKLSSGWALESSDLPGTYKDSYQQANESTVGFGNADLIQPDHTYTIKLVFPGHLGPNEFIDVTASRGYRKSPCVGGYAICVAGWTQSDSYGPGRLAILNKANADAGKTVTWSYPARATLLNRIVRHPHDHDAYVVDAGGAKHWIPDGGTYLCLTAAGYPVVNSFAGIDQRWVINSFPQGANQTCGAGTAAPPPVQQPPDQPPPTSGSPTVQLAQGPAAPAGYRYVITLDGFPAGAAVSISCRDSVDPGGFYAFTMVADGSGHAFTQNYCYSGDGPDHWVVAGGVESNHVSWGGTAQLPPPQPEQTWAEQETPNHPVNTFTNYHNASGMGPAIAAGQWVQVSCKVYDPFIASVNPDGYWYRIATSPWNDAYYSPANTFMNGDPYGGPYAHNTDFAVRDC